MMRGILIVLPFLVVGCFPPQPPQKDPQEEIEELNGTWKVVSKRIDGFELVELKKTEEFITFKHGEFTWFDSTGPAGKIVSIDPSKNPKEIDYQYKEGAMKGKTFKAIYKLYGDTFTDCFGPDGETNRPIDFHSNRFNKLTVQVYQRVKKKE